MTEPVDPEDGLDVVAGVPAGVEDDDSVGGDEVDAEAAGPGGDQEETHPQAGALVEVIAISFSSLSRSASIQSKKFRLFLL